MEPIEKDEIWLYKGRQYDFRVPVALYAAARDELGRNPSPPTLMEKGEKFLSRLHEAADVLAALLELGWVPLPDEGGQDALHVGKKCRPGEAVKDLESLCDVAADQRLLVSESAGETDSFYPVAGFLLEDEAGRPALRVLA